MIQITAYLRTEEDLALWKTLINKSEFLHRALIMEQNSGAIMAGWQTTNAAEPSHSAQAVSSASLGRSGATKPKLPSLNTVNEPTYAPPEDVA